MRRSLKIALAATATLAAAGGALFASDPAAAVYRLVSLAGIPIELGAPDLPLGPDARWHDDYFAVEWIDAQTVAIGEPRYYQKNVAYLIMGETRALLLDSGPGVRDMAPLVRSLTSLPVTAIASHLHYDHVGNLGAFDEVAMIDLPHLRAQVAADGTFAFGGEQHLGAAERREPPRIQVSAWLAPDAAIDLGGRTLRLLSTPGHTPDSVMLYDEGRRQLFTGDHLYPGHLFAVLPGADMGAYLESTQKVLSLVHDDALLLAGHSAADEAAWKAPRLARADLADLGAALARMRDGAQPAEGAFPRVYRVNERIAILAPFTWNMDWSARTEP